MGKIIKRIGSVFLIAMCFLGFAGGAWIAWSEKRLAQIRDEHGIPLPPSIVEQAANDEMEQELVEMVNIPKTDKTGSRYYALYEEAAEILVVIEATPLKRGDPEEIGLRQQNLETAQKSVRAHRHVLVEYLRKAGYIAQPDMSRTPKMSL